MNIVERNKEEILKTYNEGKNDSEISRIIKCSPETIRNWRVKNNYKANFKYENKERIENIRELVDDGLLDREIAKKLNISKSAVYRTRINNNMTRANYKLGKVYKANKLQRHVLIGTLLGDSSLHLDKDCINPRFKCDHGPLQKDYCHSKFEVFKDMGMKFRYRKRLTPDKRTGKYYESYVVESRNNPYFLKIYKNMYIDGIKRINNTILKDFNEISLAYLFMDDGAKHGDTIKIYTNGFIKEDVKILIDFFYRKFDLKFTIHSNNSIYLIKSYFKKFKELVEPYIHKTMLYKIKDQRVT